MMDVLEVMDDLQKHLYQRPALRQPLLRARAAVAELIEAANRYVSFDGSIEEQIATQHDRHARLIAALAAVAAHPNDAEGRT